MSPGDTALGSPVNGETGQGFDPHTRSSCGTDSFFFFFSLSLSLSKLKIAPPSCKGPSDALILGVDRCNDVDATMAFGTMS
jgi:hypothetical protein